MDAGKSSFGLPVKASDRNLGKRLRAVEAQKKKASEEICRIKH